MRALEQLLTKHLLPIAAVLALLVILGLTMVLKYTEVTVDQASHATDVVLKAVALLVGAAWTLNRYFVTRSDYPQLRVDMVTDVIPAKAFGKSRKLALLTFRLDIVNTGKIVLEPKGYRLAIRNVTLVGADVRYEELYQWPARGFHGGGTIEPGSWEAISDAIPLPIDCVAVQIFLYIRLNGEREWTWHRIVPTRKT